MRRLLLLLAVLAILPGCTNLRLKRSILNQTSTLTELQYQQVLSNLAMLSKDPYALPAHANLRDGSAQIQDFGSAVAGAELTFTSKGLPSLTGSRTVVEQWGVEPVTSDTELKLMRVAYRRALGLGDTLDAKLANDIAHELCRQISQADDIDLRSDPTINNAAMRSKLGLLDQALVIDSAQQNPAPLPPALTDSPGPVPIDDGSGYLTRDRKLDYYRENFQRNEPFVLSISQLADSLSYLRLQSNDKTIIADDEWNERDFDITARFHRIKGSNQWVPFTATPIVREARRQTFDLFTSIQEIQPGWFGVGCKKDVPHNATYVGRYKDRYAWVCPEGNEQLAEFTLKMLSFSGLIKEPSVLTIPGGPRFTPATGAR